MVYPAQERTHRFWKDARGAVYVEFLVAFMPVLVFFLCLLQLTLLFASKLLVDHAAVQGARAAAVVIGDEPGPYGDRAGDTNALTRGRRQAVRDAVLISLAPLILDGSIEHVNVVIPPEDTPGGRDQPEGARLSPMATSGPHMLRLRVEADVVCKIAMADVIICHRSGPGLRRVATANAEVIQPYQGASYAYE